jgi:ARP2/3 complex subunit ARPC4
MEQIDLSRQLSLLENSSAVADKLSLPEVEVGRYSDEVIRTSVGSTRVTISRSINSSLISILFRRTDHLDSMLIQTYCNFMKKRTHIIPLFKKVCNEDLEFLFLQRHMTQWDIETLSHLFHDFIKSFIQDIHEQKIFLNCRRREAALQFSSVQID